MAKTYYQENGQLHPLEIVTAVTGGPTPPVVDKTMVVTASDAGGGTFKADKTAAEIANAEAADKIIELRYNTDRYQFVGMVGENESQAAQFDRIGVSETDIDQLTIFIDLEGNIRTENSLYEHDITLGIMGAAIGKAAVVRSIDDAGHPTSWGLESIPGAYRLPHASAGSLGGVKADPKTDEDTQPVHIGEDNKLYTKPGTGGGGAKLMWENRNPTLPFNPQTISIPGFSNHSLYYIGISTGIGTGGGQLYMGSGIMVKTKNPPVNLVSYYGLRMISNQPAVAEARGFGFVTEGFKVYAGESYNLTKGTSTVNNEYAKPLFIYALD